MSDQTLQYVYFGGEPIGVPVLERLIDRGLRPALVVCNPDRQAGRGHHLTPPPVKVCANKYDIPVWQPNDLADRTSITEYLKDHDLFVVVAYNRILPQWLIELPRYQTINVHPSLLPRRRGPNPIRSAIAENDRDSIGVSIMLMDAQMDHGPILAQRALPIDDEQWPMRGPLLDQALAECGGTLLADTIPSWVAGMTEPIPQAHEQATYTTKLTRSDGELTLDPRALPTGEEARTTLRLIRAYEGWPGTFFFHEGKRIKVNAATIIDDHLVLESVTPEGKAPQPFAQWLPSNNR